MNKILILLTFLISACKYDEITSQDEYAKYRLNISLPHVFLFKLDTYKRNGLLEIKSTEIFNCSSTTIKTTSFVRGNEIIIRVDGILKPAECYPALTPANSAVKLPENIEKITFLNGRKIDQYELYHHKINKVIENQFTQLEVDL